MLMNPTDIVVILCKMGWRQEEIARKVGCPQATISRIGSGVTTNPHYLLVDKLRELFDSQVKTKRNKHG